MKDLENLLEKITENVETVAVAKIMAESVVFLFNNMKELENRIESELKRLNEFRISHNKQEARNG